MKEYIIPIKPELQEDELMRQVAAASKNAKLKVAAEVDDKQVNELVSKLDKQKTKTVDIETNASEAAKDVEKVNKELDKTGTKRTFTLDASKANKAINDLTRQFFGFGAQLKSVAEDTKQMRELVTNVKDVNSALKLAGTALDIFSKVSLKTVITDVKQVGTVFSSMPQALKQVQTSVKAISFKDMTTGVNSLGTGIKSAGAAMKSLTGVIGTGTKALQAFGKASLGALGLIQAVGPLLNLIPGFDSLIQKLPEPVQKVLSTFFGINASVKETAEALKSWDKTTRDAIDANIMYQRKAQDGYKLTQNEIDIYTKKLAKAEEDLLLYSKNRNLSKADADDVEQLTKQAEQYGAILAIGTKEKEQAKEKTNYIAEANKLLQEQTKLSEDYTASQGNIIQQTEYANQSGLDALNKQFEELIEASKKQGDARSDWEKIIQKQIDATAKHEERALAELTKAKEKYAEEMQSILGNNPFFINLTQLSRETAEALKTLKQYYDEAIKYAKENNLNTEKIDSQHAARMQKIYENYRASSFGIINSLAIELNSVNIQRVADNFSSSNFRKLSDNIAKGLGLTNTAIKSLDLQNIIKLRQSITALDKELADTSNAVQSFGSSIEDLFRSLAGANITDTAFSEVFGSGGIQQQVNAMFQAFAIEIKQGASIPRQTFIDSMNAIFEPKIGELKVNTEQLADINERLWSAFSQHNLSATIKQQQKAWLQASESVQKYRSTLSSFQKFSENFAANLQVYDIYSDQKDYKTAHDDLTKSFDKEHATLRKQLVKNEILYSEYYEQLAEMEAEHAEQMEELEKEKWVGLTNSIGSYLEQMKGAFSGYFSNVTEAFKAGGEYDITKELLKNYENEFANLQKESIELNISDEALIEVNNSMTKVKNNIDNTKQSMAEMDGQFGTMIGVQGAMVAFQSINQAMSDGVLTGKEFFNSMLDGVVALLPQLLTATGLASALANPVTAILTIGGIITAITAMKSLLAFEEGGTVPGVYKGYDSVLAKLSPQEEIIRRDVAIQHRSKLQHLNQTGQWISQTISTKGIEDRLDKVYTAVSAGHKHDIKLQGNVKMNESIYGDIRWQMARTRR